MHLPVNISVIGALLLTFQLHAQKVLKTSNDSDSKSGVVVTVLNPHGKTPVSYDGHSLYTDSVQQAIKINFLQLARGEFALYYEHRLGDPFSFEIGAGVTYVDYLYEIFVNESRFLGKNSEGRSVRFLSGFAGHAQLRWYPSKYETAISGYYFGADVSRRDWQMDYLVNTGLISEPTRIKRRWSEFKLQFGFQDAEPYENTFWEWFVAGGLRFADEETVDGAGIDAVFNHQRYWQPVIAIGLKMGFTL